MFLLPLLVFLKTLFTPNLWMEEFHSDSLYSYKDRTGGAAKIHWIIMWTNKRLNEHDSRSSTEASLNFTHTHHSNHENQAPETLGSSRSELYSK